MFGGEPEDIEAKSVPKLMIDQAIDIENIKMLINESDIRNMSTSHGTSN